MFVQRKYERDNATQAYLQRKNKRDNMVTLRWRGIGPLLYPRVRNFVPKIYIRSCDCENNKNIAYEYRLSVWAVHCCPMQEFVCTPVVYTMMDSENFQRSPQYVISERDFAKV